MAAPEISIPSTHLSSAPKPYTQYNITLRLPLRTFAITKRYSDFAALHSALVAATSQPPPAPLPPKSYFPFTATSTSPARTEARRAGLEAYLRGINGAADPRWRTSAPFRAFLNLPPATSARSSTASSLHGALASAAGGPPTDPVVWLDAHRDLKAQLHDARLAVAARDAAGSTAARHEAGAAAKKGLVRAGALVSALALGLGAQRREEWGPDRLGEGELRRRRDLVASARRELESLEALLTAMVAKEGVDATVVEREALVGKAAAGKKAGRVLGKETARTRELDNAGVLGLQQQVMRQQEEDVMVLAEAVRRQKELGIRIQEELEVQNDMLGILDEDVTRVAAKVAVANKKASKVG
jgi:regulator of vacuolar morphogenesis